MNLYKVPQLMLLWICPSTGEFNTKNQSSRPSTVLHCKVSVRALIVFLVRITITDEIAAIKKSRLDGGNTFRKTKASKRQITIKISFPYVHILNSWSVLPRGQ